MATRRLSLLIAIQSPTGAVQSLKDERLARLHGNRALLQCCSFLPVSQKPTFVFRCPTQLFKKWHGLLPWFIFLVFLYVFILLLVMKGHYAKNR